MTATSVGRLGVVGVALVVAGGPASGSQAPVTGVTEITVEVELDCPSCAAGLERRLSRLDGVRDVDVRADDGRVVITPGPAAIVHAADVREVIRNAGFVPTVVGVTAVGLLLGGDGAPVLQLPGGGVLRLETDDPGLSLAEWMGRPVRVRGRAHPAADGAERISVGSLERVDP